jgi:hypothetical protein
MTCISSYSSHATASSWSATGVQCKREKQQSRVVKVMHYMNLNSVLLKLSKLVGKQLLQSTPGEHS